MFVVLKTRSHVADATFHGSGAELFQGGEWGGVGRQICLEKYGGQRCAEGLGRRHGEHLQGGIQQAACGETALCAWGGISAVLVTPGFEGLSRCCFTRETCRGLKDRRCRAAHIIPHRWGAMTSLAGICREPVDSEQRHLVSSVQPHTVFCFRAAVRRTRGVRGEGAMWLLTSWPALH